MIAHPVRKFLLAASFGAALVGFASMASALPIYNALTLVKAAPSAVEDVQWRGRRAGWRRWGWRGRWVGWRRTYPIGRYHIEPPYPWGYVGNSCREVGYVWPTRLGCW
jgi:hypothetical protein